MIFRLLLSEDGFYRLLRETFRMICHHVSSCESASASASHRDFAESEAVHSLNATGLKYLSYLCAVLAVELLIANQRNGKMRRRAACDRRVRLKSIGMVFVCLGAFKGPG